MSGTLPEVSTVSLSLARRKETKRWEIISDRFRKVDVSGTTKSRHWILTQGSHSRLWRGVVTLRGSGDGHRCRDWRDWWGSRKEGRGLFTSMIVWWWCFHGDRTRWSLHTLCGTTTPKERGLKRRRGFVSGTDGWVETHSPLSVTHKPLVFVPRIFFNFF